VDVLINRALVYAALSLCVVALYVGVVAYLGSLFRTSANLAVSLVATALVAVVFQPLRQWLQREVNRLLHGQRDEPYAVLARLGQQLEAALAPGSVLESLVTTVREALKLPYAAVALRRDGSFAVAAASGAPAAGLLRLSLSYQGEEVGQLLLAPRAAGESWSAADRRLLDDLARHAGVAVHGIQVMAELQRARQQLVLAREEERRRLRRDLHDDLAPSRAALGLTAAAAEELLATDPVAAAAAIARLRTSIRAAVGDVRRLVYDLRPPTLDELGFAEAVRECAAHSAAHGTSGPPVTVDLPAAMPPLPAAVEVAAYRIIQEGLTNVVRHAAASACVVRVACAEGDRLLVEVTDDGVGLPDQRRAGVGLHSMRERAAELGGACTVERVSAAGGTRVSAWLPIGSISAALGVGE
jgi:signal transduction histidine kinase